jgi:hypothetical protein
MQRHTYTAAGPVLDRLTPSQRQILALLDISLPWIEQAEKPPHGAENSQLVGDPAGRCAV